LGDGCADAAGCAGDNGDFTLGTHGFFSCKKPLNGCGVE
jgi:hypothetical protein